jgi:hypothetical protein
MPGQIVQRPVARARIDHGSITGRSASTEMPPLRALAHRLPLNWIICCSICWQSVQREKTMKRSAIRSRTIAEFPIAWSKAEYAALLANTSDTCDDRVSENIFDVEDERAEVDIIVHRMFHGAN